MPHISEIVLYDWPALNLELRRLSEFIKDTFGIGARVAELPLHGVTDRMLEKIAACRIFEFGRPHRAFEPSPEQIELEREHLQGTSAQNVIAYDGFMMQQVLGELVPSERIDILGIVFTPKLACTYDESDSRYHGRALVGSNPAIVSTSGIIEAPAKPREYYMDLAASMPVGLNVEAIKSRYAGRYLECDDPRLGVILEGYLLQAVFYYITGDAFCADRDCRLYNAHWQSDLLHSQIRSGRLCEAHAAILAGILK